MTDEWRAIPGWEGLYEVSASGAVRSVDRRKPYRGGSRIALGVELRRTYVKGYPRVNLWRDGCAASKLVHVLVASAFLPPPPTPAHQLNHRDGMRAHAAALNLEWLTASENLTHAYRVLGRKPACGKSFGAANGRFKDGSRARAIA